MEISLKPRVRTYREKSRRSAIRESAEQKQETRRKLLEKQKKETEKLQALEVDGKICFDKLPVLEPKDSRDSFEMVVRCHGIRRFFGKDRRWKKIYIGQKSGRRKLCSTL